MLVNEVEYNYSYVLAQKSMKTNNIESSHIISLDDWTLYHSEDMDITYLEKGDDSITILGYMLDIRNGMLTNNEIGDLLLSSDNLDKELDYINGRYIIIVKKNNKMFVYTDASALMPINYYNKGRNLIASHDLIIRDILEYNSLEVKEIPESLIGSFDYTRYKSVFKFNPSLKFNMVSGEFERYYPREMIKQKSVKEIMKELDIYFTEMITWLKQWQSDIILTLTGGYDSRVSMALTNEISDKVEYLTYLHPNVERLSDTAKQIYENDVFITNEISRNLKVNHTKVDLSKYSLNEQEKMYYKNILQTAHSFPLIDYFKNKRKFDKVLHIKSTVFGMGKSDFPLNKNHNPKNYEEMAEFIHGVSDEAKERSNYDRIVSDYFKRNMQSENVGSGRHYFEIFHLESRMANWHSNVTQETDPELLEFIFVNSRRIIDLLQSPSIQERRDKILYKHLISEHWPALLFIGFNEKIYNIDFNLLGIESNHYVNGLNIYELSNLEMTKLDDSSIEVKPEGEKVGPGKSYLFKAKNKTNKNKKLSLKSMFDKESSRDNISVAVMKLNEKSASNFDIVELSKGTQLTLEPFEEFMIKINYHHNFEKQSWQQAGRVVIEGI